MLLGLGLFLWAGLQMSRKIEPYWTWFYCFAWWSFILFSQSLLHRRGARSLLFEQPGRFFLLAFFSISLWLVFEVWNFRLNNWEYHQRTRSNHRPMAWLCYLIRNGCARAPHHGASSGPFRGLRFSSNCGKSTQ